MQAAIDAGMLDGRDMPIVLRCVRRWHEEKVWSLWQRDRVWEMGLEAALRGLEFLEGEARWMEAHAAVIHACVLHDGMPPTLQTCLAGVEANLEAQACRLRNAAKSAD